MPRDLADVLHHLIPDVEAVDSSAPAAPSPRRGQPAPVPDAVLAVPIAGRDVVRAAFSWNLAFEIRRAGARATVVAPAADEHSGLWPDPDGRPGGTEIVWAAARDLPELERVAFEVAREPGPRQRGPGIVLVRVPPLWLRAPSGAARLLRWTLLLTSSEPRDLLESYGIAKLLRAGSGDARIGVSVHGARRKGEAAAAFNRLADVSRRRLDLSLTSYGQLVDDIQVYRAIVAQRPIGLIHPQSPAARSLSDVAELLLADAGVDSSG